MQDAEFMFQIPWDYGDKAIRLWVYEVFVFEGEPRGLEGQAVQWFSADAVKTLQFPKANDAIVRAIGLPRMMRIYDPSLMLEPVTWGTQIEYRCLLYFRGLLSGVELETAINAALSRGHQVILTLDQLLCFRFGCGVHLRKTDRVSDARGQLEQLNEPWPITAGIRHGRYRKTAHGLRMRFNLAGARHQVTIICSHSGGNAFHNLHAKWVCQLMR